MKIAIITGPKSNVLSIFNPLLYDYVIGADSGAAMIADEHIYFDLAIGDFDSTDYYDLTLVKQYAKEILTYPDTKDFTDTYLAVEKALEMEPTIIDIYGGIGSRIDHTLANINLLKMGNVQLITENTRLYLLSPGAYSIDNNYQYISFFPLEDVLGLSLHKFKYELNDFYLRKDSSLCISNEGNGDVSFKEGLLLVIHQNEY